MSEIVLTGVSKRWGAARAVEDISLNAAAGELLVLLGPSGCGKSTTLRLIAGLEATDAGTIRIAGRDVTQLPPGERRIAMVFQSYALFPHLTVAENIVFGLRARRVPRAECRARLTRVAVIVGLEGLLDRKPAQLSGGQRQRVALGRAIIAEAPVCLMDEPLSNLDAKLRNEMRAEIRGLQQRLGITMIYVTHDQTEAMTMADRIVLMRDGKIEQNGPPQELYSRPVTAFAARFIGTPPMNLLPGHDDVLIGIRPEHLRVVPHGGVSAKITATEHLGAESIVLCEVEGRPAAFRQEGFSACKSGDVVQLAWSPQHVHCFDRETGARLDAGKATDAALAGAHMVRKVKEEM
jgi:sn-glycerol 3-phosphate transport system ATP-binding protein